MIPSDETFNFLEWEDMNPQQLRGMLIDDVEIVGVAALKKTDFDRPESSPALELLEGVIIYFDRPDGMTQAVSLLACDDPEYLGTMEIRTVLFPTQSKKEGRAPHRQQNTP